MKISIIDKPKFSIKKMLKLLTELFVYLTVIVQAANAFEWNDKGRNIWALGCNFNGNDLSRVNVAGEFCSEECGKVAACTHYSWANGVLLIILTFSLWKI